MKKNLAIIILILLGSFPSVAQKTDTTINKMRTFRVKEKRMIGLQAPIDKLKEITIKSRNDHYYLKKGTFGGTDSIDIEVNKTNQIIAVSFFYDTASTYSYEVDLFNKHLNFTGIETELISNGSSTKVTRWEDKYTAFEMVELRTGENWKIYSTIFDKDLFFNKVKPCMELSKNKTPIEILKTLKVL